MAALPDQPIPPAAFMEEFLPAAAAEGRLAELAAGGDARLGVRLEGEGGGEWVVTLARGALRVAADPRDATPFSVVMSVEDWRGALWEGRGGLFGALAVGLLTGAGGDAVVAAGGASGLLGALSPSAAAIEQLGAFDGLIRIVVSGGAGGDWTTGLRLGAGPIPDEATTTITVTSEDAAAMQSGDLDPIAALMSGRIRVVGDMALLMQMQAVVMAAATGDA